MGATGREAVLVLEMTWVEGEEEEERVGMWGAMSLE